jgi:sialate O-acetylesterase
MSRFMLTLVMFACCTAAHAAELRMPSVFSDHMVLQQGKPVPIWGWTNPGRKVHVELGGGAGYYGSHFVRADESGHWICHLPPMEASSRPRSLTINTIETDGSVLEERVFTDVLIGEVWICSGQSNMEWKLEWCDQSDIDTTTADHDQLRMFTAPHVSVPQPRTDVDGSWVVCNRENAPGLSAVAYYFGRDLQRELDVPIGLIHTSWGGSSAEAWTSLDRLASMEETRPILTRFERMSMPDPDTPGHTSLILDDRDWEPVALPSMFKEQGEDLDGVVWYRHHFQIPEEWNDRELELTLGAIDDSDRTYLNGQLIGQGSDWRAPRRYMIPPALVRSGPAVLTVRVQDLHGLGGFSGEPKDMRLGLAGEDDGRIDLSGSWVRRISDRPMQQQVGHNHRPAHLANGMLAPFVPYAFQGVIWYQGESNVTRAAQYELLFPAMIEDWRERWGGDAFPFYFVQIAPYDYGMPMQCAELREAQAAALRLPATGMVVTMDVGNPKDIHPVAKQPVGERLALLARRDAYGQDVVAEAPSMGDMTVDGDTVTLRFTGRCLPLSTRDGSAPTHFEVAGEDQVYHPATARIDGDTVVVRNDAVPAPIAVRFAWHDAAEPNLSGACGLPVGPFRSDRWPRVTDGNW